MEMDMRRLVLQASLRMLFDMADTGHNIAACLENMRSLFAEVDEVSHQVRRSNASDWARRALLNANLERLGEFRVTVTTTKKRRIVLFSLEEKAIKFSFKPDPRTPAEQVESVVGLMKTPDAAEREKVLDAFKKSILLPGRKSVEENLLGKKPLALDDYSLVEVELLYRRPIILELFIGPRRETIYKSL